MVLHKVKECSVLICVRQVKHVLSPCAEPAVQNLDVIPNESQQIRSTSSVERCS